jgi:hypothetical protein
MSLYESGYFREKSSGMLRGKDFGTLSLVGEKLIFNGKKGKQVIIDIMDIEDVGSHKNCVYLTLKNKNTWEFHIHPYWRGQGLMEGMENIRKAKTMRDLLNYLINDREKNE